jgi:hypothetical protein
MNDPDNGRCVVLVPVAHHVDPDCETALRALEARGYPVWRVFGHAAIDQGRSQMATDALADGFDQLMWIDADVAFDPDAVDRLRAHHLPLVCGICAKKGSRALACHVAPGTRQIVFGEGGGLIELRYGGTGFLLTDRRLYDEVQAQERLPVCNARRGRPIVPYFLPMVIPDGPDGHWYLGEDFAFFERARRAGHRVMADTTIRLRHVGRYGYTWEDAGTEVPRFARFDLTLE